MPNSWWRTLEEQGSAPGAGLDGGGLSRGYDLPSGRGHQAAEVGIKDVRCRKRCHVHGTWRHHKELVDRHDDEVRSRIGCLRSEHLGEAENTR